MTLWFLDASVLLAAEDPDDQNHAAATQLLMGSDPLATLDLAFYEVSNVALLAWRDRMAAQRLYDRVAAVSDDGGMLRIDPAIIASAVDVASEHAISVYDAAYVAAARASGGELVSCDVRDLVSQGLARLPEDAFIG